MTGSDLRGFRIAAGLSRRALADLAEVHPDTAMLHKSSRDSCRESSVVTGPHEQTDITYLQDYELGCLKRGAEAPWVTDDLVRSRDELACQTARQEGQITDIQ